MNQFGKTLYKATKDIVLGKEEKGAMRDVLCAYVKGHPVEREQWPVISPLRVHKSPLWMVRLTPRSFGAFALMLSLLLGTGSVSYAAEDALPGDILYSVKVRVNEEVQGVLAVSDEEKVSWAKERAERRVSEASELASQGRLDAEKKETVAHLLEEHTQEAVETIRTLEEKDPVLGTELSDDLASSLKEHGDTLARIVVNDNTQEDVSSRMLIQTVQQAVADAKDVKAEAEAKLDLPEEGATSTPADTTLVGAYVPDDEKLTSPDIRVRAVFRMQKSTHDLLAETKEVLSHLDAETPAYVKASEEYADIEASVAQADASLQANLLGNSYRAFSEAQDRLRTLMTALATPNVVPVKEPEVVQNEGATTSVPEEQSETRARALREVVSEKIRGFASSTEGADARANAFQGEVAYEAGMYDIATDYFKKAEAFLKEKEATTSEGMKDEKEEKAHGETSEQKKGEEHAKEEE
jgi:hypothetical protein